jgi:hypothetical protein
MEVKMRKKWVFVCLVLLLLPSSVYAGAWTSEPLHSWHKLGVAYFYSDEVWNDDGETESVDTEYTEWSVSYYGQLGITGWFDIWTSFAYKYGTSEDDEEILTTAGISDITLATKFRFLQKPLVMSGQFAFTAPWAYDKDAWLPLGDGFPDYEVKLLIGRSMYPVPGYFGAEGGYKIREGFQPNVWTYLVELGFNVWKIYARVKLDGFAGAEGADEDPTGGRSVSLDSNLGKLESTLGVQIIKYIGIEGSYTYQMWGRNTGRGDTIAAGITGTF